MIAKQYHHIGGSLPMHTTGLPTNVESTLKDGFSRFECEGLDAIELMPAGGMRRIEWESCKEPVVHWFEAQISILRYYL